MNNSPQKVLLTRVLDAPRERVWRAWTDPELLKKWWGPEGFTAPSIKLDLRVGGQYIFAMHGPEGSEWDKDMYSAGVYQEIVLNEKLVVTDYFSDEEGNMLDPTEFGQDPAFPKESVMTVLFEEVEDGKTKISLLYPEPATEAEQQALEKSGSTEGWNSSFNKLEKILIE